MQEIVRVNKKEAVETLTEIDSLIAEAEKSVEHAGDCFIDLSFLLLKVKRGAYWTERGFKSEHEYIEKVFPQSRAQYYAFISFGTHLLKYPKIQLKGWGRSKCEDLVRLHVHFDGEVPEEWFGHLDEDNKNTFRRRVREFLDKKSITEKGERQERVDKGEADVQVEDSFITFKALGNGIHTINLAIETAKKILGTDKSVGYIFEMICANWNAQFAEDGTGHVVGKNSYILGTIEGLVKQLDLKSPETSEMLIGIVARGVDQNVGTS